MTWGPMISTISIQLIRFYNVQCNSFYEFIHEGIFALRIRKKFKLMLQYSLPEKIEKKHQLRLMAGFYGFYVKGL